MIGKSLLLPAATCSLLGLYASAVAVTKDVDIVVTHSAGSLLTTYTVQETSGKSQPAGTAYIAGQSFRRGDLPPGTYPVFRDAKTHIPLIQQLDEIATRRENGDDGSIRHLVFSVQLPAIPANGTYTMEIVRQSGTYSATAKQSLAALAKAHDLKLHLTDVRNQDGTLRGSGSLTFDINSAASNTGRDAPRACAAGPVRDCWIVVGPPIDDATHQPDPLLYVSCYLDLTTSASDQTSLGPVRHVCRVDNSWQNVAAGTTGNAGNPGPAGFANDPQALSYRPQLLDGSQNLLDWSWLDATVNSSANPITTGGDNNTGCVSQTLHSNGNWTIPSSTGRNTWYFGMPVFYHTNGTPPTGMTNDKLYFVMPVGLGYSYHDVQPNSDRSVVHLMDAPFICSATAINPTDQGSGDQTFSFRVWHTHWMSWHTTDQTGAENWTNGTSRVVTSLYPQFSAAEQLYWKETGTIPPLRITAGSVPSDPINGVTWLDYNYEPMSRVTTIGGSGVGSRADIGLVNEWAAQAFLLETQTTWEHMRLFALAGDHYPIATLLNEATGRIPVDNNGPPGADHGGAGGSYPLLGAPQPNLYIFDPVSIYFDGVAKPLINTPVASTGYLGGIWGSGLRSYGNDHEPSFQNMVYTIFGSRHYLDDLYFAGNRQIVWQQTGNFFGAKDNTVAGVHYWGLHLYCCEFRGDFWGHRDALLPAALGGDSSPERVYFNDQLIENYYYEQAETANFDGSSHNFSNSLARGHSSGFWDVTFMDAYGMQTSYLGYAMMRDPLSALWIPHFLNNFLMMCSDTVVGARGIAGEMSSAWCASYYYSAALRDSSTLTGAITQPNSGQYYVVDGTEWGISGGNGVTWMAGSPTVNNASGFTLSDGDQIKNMAVAGISPNPDQLHRATWYTITNVDNVQKTFQIIDPSTGRPFQSYTEGGQPIGAGVSWSRFRFYNNPSTGWSDGTYPPYAQSAIYALKDLGFSAILPAYNRMSARGFVEPGGTQTWLNWDPNVIVP